MSESAYCLFETPLGMCALAWRETGKGCAVTHVKLPGASPELTEQRIARSSAGRKTDKAPAAIAAVIEKIRKHLGGELQDFRDVPMDLSAVREFERAVYQAAMRIPAGETRTYGEIANLLSDSVERLASNLKLPVPRAVGQALARNPIPIIIPCHRVLAANGRLGGFSAPGALRTKARLLQIEGAKFPALLAFPN
jgi:O-6-methylguanine DNA methyltransferase